jgi:phosphoribosylanthranilate isomerase
MKLKICGMKDRENILSVLENKPDYLGFIFYKKSPRYAGELSPDFVQSINSVTKVGVFVNEKEITILDYVARYGLDLVQLHGDEDPNFCKELQKNIKVIKAFGITNEFDFSVLNKFENACDYFLFDASTSYYGGSGKTFDWKKLSDYNLKKPFFLSGGIGPENIYEAININSSFLFAIDVNSKAESAPGIKRTDLIKELKNKMK